MRNIFCFLFLFASIVSLAQQNNNKLGQDPKATPILDKLSETMQSYNDIQANFLFIFESAQEDIRDTIKGEFFLKGEKYKLTMPQLDKYYDGVAITTYMKESNEAMIEDPDFVENDINPAEIFTIYKDNYKYKYNGEELETGVALEVIDLFPVDVDEKNFSRIRLKIIKKKNQILSLQQFNKDGNRTTIRLKNMKANVGLDDNTFKFDETKYPDVLIEDMR